MKGTQLGKWKDLVIGIVGLLSFQIFGWFFGSLILAGAIYWIYRNNKK